MQSALLLVKIQKSTAWTFFKKGGLIEKVTELTAELAAPVIAAQGCELWDVEYVKEAGTWYLRLYIDKEGRRQHRRLRSHFPPRQRPPG